MSLILMSKTPLSAPLPETPSIILSGDVLASDGFGRTGSLEGSTVDNALGGILSPTWVKAGAGGVVLSTDGSKLVHVSGSGGGARTGYHLSTAIPVDAQVMAEGVSVTANGFRLIGLRMGDDGAGSRGYLLRFSSQRCRLFAGTTAIMSDEPTYPGGATLGVRAIGNTIQAIINGTVIFEVEDSSYPDAGYAGIISAADAAPGMSIDAFSVTAM